MLNVEQALLPAHRPPRDGGRDGWRLQRPGRDAEPHPATYLTLTPGSESSIGLRRTIEIAGLGRAASPGFSGARGRWCANGGHRTGRWTKHVMAFASGECLVVLLDVALQFQDDTSTRLLAQLMKTANGSACTSVNLGPLKKATFRIACSTSASPVQFWRLTATSITAKPRPSPRLGGTVVAARSSASMGATVVKPQEFLILEVVGHISPA